MDVYDSLFVQYFYVTEDDITQLTSPTPGGPNFPADVPPLGHRWHVVVTGEGTEDPKENIIISTPTSP